MEEAPEHLDMRVTAADEDGTATTIGRRLWGGSTRVSTRVSLTGGGRGELRGGTMWKSKLHPLASLRR